LDLGDLRSAELIIFEQTKRRLNKPPFCFSVISQRNMLAKNINLTVKNKIIKIATVGVLSLILRSSADEKYIMLANAAGIDTNVFEAIRSNTECELKVNVKALNLTPLKSKDLKETGKKDFFSKSKNEVCIVVFVTSYPNISDHAAIMTNEHVAVVNISALKAESFPKFISRMKRWSIRGVAFALGVTPDIDPHGVMCDYSTLNDLDEIGMNFSPPSAEMFKKLALLHGLKIRPSLSRIK
jgi:hypothetical protein